MLCVTGDSTRTLGLAVVNMRSVRGAVNQVRALARTQILVYIYIYIYTQAAHASPPTLQEGQEQRVQACVVT